MNSIFHCEAKKQPLSKEVDLLFMESSGGSPSSTAPWLNALLLFLRDSSRQKAHFFSMIGLQKFNELSVLLEFVYPSMYTYVGRMLQFSGTSHLCLQKVQKASVQISRICLNVFSRKLHKMFCNN